MMPSCSFKLEYSTWNVNKALHHVWLQKENLGIAMVIIYKCLGIAMVVNI